MHCPTCGTENEESADTCQNCGQPLPPSPEPWLRRLIWIFGGLLAVSILALIISLILLRFEKAKPEPIDTPVPSTPTTASQSTSAVSPTPEPRPTATSVPLNLPIGFEAQKVELVAQIGGRASAMAMHGEYAYLGVGSRLVVLDVSRPTAPSVLDGDLLLPGEVEAIAVQGDYAYVADGGEGLWIVDLANPAEPQAVSSFDTPDAAQDVVVVGTYAYVADKQGGLQVVDISDPTSPSGVGAVSPGWPVSALAVAEGYAYVVGGQYASGDVGIIDVTTPSSPKEAGSFASEDAGVAFAFEIAVAGDYAYVADGYGGLLVLDVSDVTAPVKVASLSPLHSSLGVAVADGYVYLTNDTGSVRAIDVSDPSSPSEVGRYEGQAYVCDMSVTAGYLYLAGGKTGLQVIDTSPPSNLVAVGTSDGTFWSARDVAVDEDYAYVTGRADVEVVDVSAPSAPEVIGARELADTLSGVSLDIDVAGDHTYVTCARPDIFHILDISQPAAPTKVGKYKIDSAPVAVAGGYAYLCGRGNLHVVDVSIPTSPREVGVYEVAGGANAKDILTVGDYAYVTETSSDGEGGTGGLRILDATDPANLKPVDFFEVPGTTSDLAASHPSADRERTHIHMANSEVGLLTIDVSQPAQPVEVASYAVPGGAEDVAAVSDRAYVIDGEKTLHIIDLSEPSKPVEVGFYRSIAGRLEAANGYLYIAGGNAGLTILRDIEVPITPTVTAERPGSSPTPASTRASNPWSLRRHNARRSGAAQVTGPETPRLKWTFEGAEHFSSPVIGADGTIYLAAGGGTLYAFDPSGAKRWTHTLPGEGMVRLALGDDGALYTAQSNTLYALRSKQPTVRWRYQTNNFIRDLTIGPDGTLYVASDELHAVDSEEGAPRWTASAERCEGFEALAASPAGVYGMTGLAVCAFAPEGQFMWRKATAAGARGFNTGLTVGPQGDIYVNGETAAGANMALPTSPLISLRRDGSVNRMWDNYFASPPAIDSEGFLYVGWREIGDTVETESGVLTAELGPLMLLARSPSTGDRWRQPLEGRLCSYPVLGGAGTLYVALCNGDIQSFGPGGAPEWSVNIGASLDKGAWTDWDLALGKGSLYVSTADSLHAIGEAE